MALRLRSARAFWRRWSAIHLGRVAQRGRPLSASPLLLQESHAPSLGPGPPYTTDLRAALTPHIPHHLIPTYRVTDASGKVIDQSQDPNLSEAMMVEIYQKMITLTEMDIQLFKAQRMGLISFYMMCLGEEATLFGSAAALDSEDMVYGQYREAGVLLWRGFTLDQFMNRCFSNRLDIASGRQMPIHYGSKEHNYQFISSSLATQMPQASGFAYGLKLSGSKNCVIVYFGDGATQEGDSHASMNFAATLRCPVIFFCRNNGYAISTPVTEQYAGDGIASRGPGYGMETIRVDGNDVLAVYNATKHAREIAVSEHRPVLIEAMTYRVGSHSTSDDQTKYQPMETVKEWKTEYNPVSRFRGYLEGRGLWDTGREEEFRKRVAKEVRVAMNKARGEVKPHPFKMFTDVYDSLPPHLEKQQKEMWEHVNKYKEHYPLELHES